MDLIPEHVIKLSDVLIEGIALNTDRGLLIGLNMLRNTNEFCD